MVGRSRARRAAPQAILGQRQELIMDLAGELKEDYLVLRVHYMDGTHRTFQLEKDNLSWHPSPTTSSLVIGHGVPRVHIPFCVIKCWELGRE